MVVEVTRVKIEPPKWRWFPSLEGHEVEVEKAEPPSQLQPHGTYAVYLDGVKVGEVFKSTRTRERSPKGKNYVTARGQTPCWRIAGPREWRFDYDSRRHAAYVLAEGSLSGVG